MIAERAKCANLSMGEFLRRAVASFRPSEYERVLEGMIDQMAENSARAIGAIDDALAFDKASDQDIVAMESKRPEVPWGYGENVGSLFPRHQNE